MEVKTSDAKHISEEMIDRNEDADEEDTDPLPPNIEDEFVQDCTLESVERLLVAESTLLHEEKQHEGTKENEEQLDFPLVLFTFHFLPYV